MTGNLQPLQETISMLSATVETTWDLLTKDQLKVIIDGYLEMLKEDSGMNNKKII